MKEISEDYVQNQIWIWYTNNYCLQHHSPRNIIFSVPNGGTRDVREAHKLKMTGLLPGVSDLIIIHFGIVYFVEVKKPNKGVQSSSQKDFQQRVESQGFKYILIDNLKDFIETFANIVKLL